MGFDRIHAPASAVAAAIAFAPTLRPRGRQNDNDTGEVIVKTTGKVVCLASASASALVLAMLFATPAHAQAAGQVPNAAQSGPVPPQTAPQPQTAPVATEAPGLPASTSSNGTDTSASPADPANPAAAANSDVVVVGTRASLQSAIARKRNAGTIVDSIVADDIASFPDKNVGDSLARITGVQLSRDFGEGTAVSIRGVEPDLNRVEINGVSQVSATGVRAGDFRELATELVKSIDVYKGYSVDLTEGGLGGTVSVETRKPLELKTALGSVVFSEQHLDTTRDWRPRATVVVGTPHFLIDGLGVLLNVTYDDKTTRQDYASNTGWQRIADFDHSDQKTVADPLYGNFNTYASCAGVGGQTTANATARRLACETQFFDWAPAGPRYRNLVRRDKRLSGDFTVQYEFAHNFRAFVEAQYNNRNQQLQDINYAIDAGSNNRFQRLQLDPALAAGLNGGTSRPQVKLGTATINDAHVVTSFQTALNSVNIGTAAAPVYNGASNILGVQYRNFDYDQKSQYYLGGFDWDVGRTKVKFLASHAKASTLNNTNLISVSTGISGVIVDSRNDLGIPIFTYPSSVNAADPSIYADLGRRGADGQLLVPSGPVVQYRPGINDNKEDQIKLDADYETDLPILKSIEYGGQFRWQDYHVYAGGGTVTITPPTATADAVFQTTSNVSYTTNIVPTVTARSTRSSNGTFVNQLTPAEYQSLIANNSGVSGGAPLFYNLNGAPASIPGRIAIPLFNTNVISQYYDLSGFDQDIELFSDGFPQVPQAAISEKIAAAYLKGNVDTNILGMRLTGNFGVRYIKTIDTGTGTNVARQTRLTPTGTTQTVTLRAQQIDLSNSYTDWLPAFNAALEITPELVLRANWARNLARPKPTDLVPNINCLDDATIAAADDVCTAGNPGLLPYRADQWEVNLSWFPNRDTLLSVGYFKKYEKSFVVPNVTQSGVDLFGDGVTSTVRRPINGFGALIDGIEASAQTAFTFLPKPLDGFGASANFTYSRPIRTNLTNTATNQPLAEYPGLSTYTYNASIFYDKGFLNARLAYNYRSDWLVTVVDATNGNNPIYRQAEGYLDGKITFRFPEYHYSLFMEMQNINKEYSRSYIKGIGTSEVYYPGQRFFAGFQVKF